MYIYLLTYLLTYLLAYMQIHHTCLYIVSVHQTAPSLGSGSSHLLQLTTHLSTP